MSDTTDQTHPFGLYLKIWALLFILSTFSYLVDFFHVQGMLRWSLVMVFMLLKAGFIISIFMHLQWERMALKCVLLGTPALLLALIGLMAIEGSYTNNSREVYFSQSPNTFIEPHGAAKH